MATRIADGEFDGVLVPEGFDDMSLEGRDSTNVQVKSRQDRLGAFPMSDAAAHVLDAATANAAREEPAGRVVVVFERGVEGATHEADDFGDVEQPLEASSPFGQVVWRRARTAGRSEGEISHLLASVTVVGVSWDRLDKLIDEGLSGLTGRVGLEGRRLVARSLMASVAAATDHNAAASHPDRKVLDRTGIVEQINRDAEQIDVEALEAALSLGICEVPDYATPLERVDLDRFYEGEAVQPHHVSAGLVSPRPDLVTEVVMAAEELRPILLNGPSGVGKSAVLWTIPLAMRGVLWFRVRRLDGHEDAVALRRLARAHGASSDRPVGFLVDGAGAGRVRAWTDLRDQVEGLGGVVLVASVRNEDLIQLGDLGGCTSIEVALDEPAAEAIYEGLVRRGATDQPHWREAFGQAAGLTLEFTYLLSQGRRLREVIDDQVAVRVREHRATELDLLALVSAVHRWGANLDTACVIDRLGATDARVAVRRLVDEHLVVESMGILTGLHPLRSEAISESVHATPPPVWSKTIEAVLDLLDDDQLPTLIRQVLHDRPELTPIVVDAGAAEAATARRTARVLEGLRHCDNEVQVSRWLQIAAEDGILPFIQLTVVLLAITGVDMGELVPPPVVETLQRMAPVPPGVSRNLLISRLGERHLRRLLLGASAEDALVLLAALEGATVDLAAPNADDPTTLLEELPGVGLEALGELLAAARNCGSGLAEHMVDALGGEPAVMDLIRLQSTWLLDLEVVVDGSDRVARARLLHVADELHERAHDRVVGLARVLLRTLPSIDRTDVKALLPGGHPYVFGDVDLASTGLIRRNDHDPVKVAWNQARMAAARSFVGVADSARLAAAVPLIRDLAEFVRDFGNRWVRRDGTSAQAAQMARDLERIVDAAHHLGPSLGRSRASNETEAVDKEGDAGGLGPLSFIPDIVDNVIPRLVNGASRPPLIAFLSDKVIPAAATAEAEPWHLLGSPTAVIASLRQIAEALERILAVLRLQELGQAEEAEGHQAARSASRSGALEAAARRALAALGERLETRRAGLARTLSTTVGLPIGLLAEEAGGATRFALTIEVPSMFEWAERQGEVVDAVQRARHQREQFLIVPTRSGRRIPGHAVNLILTALPAPEVGGWADRLPEPVPTPRTDLVNLAVQSLQHLSGLNDLRPDRRACPDVMVCEANASQQLERAVREIETGPADDLRDRVLEMITSWKAAIDAEVPGEAEKPTFASSYVAGMLGTPNDLVNAIGMLRLTAIEWEIDPDVVGRRLGP